jgi:hypothetical protein
MTFLSFARAWIDLPGRNAPMLAGIYWHDGRIVDAPLTSTAAHRTPLSQARPKTRLGSRQKWSDPGCGAKVV